MEASERCRALLQRCSHHDKDERYMAISDLRCEIEAVDVIDVSLQTTMRQTMLKRLEDPSSDVQAIAVNCFSSMVEKFDPSQVVEIIATLCNLSNIQSGADLKEVYAEALRGILEHVPWSLGEQVSSILLPILIGTLSSDSRHEPKDSEGRFWCVMLLQTVLDRFVGCPIGNDNFQSILALLLQLISEETDYNNNLIANVVASFTNSCPSYLLADLVKEIISQISSNLPNDKAAVLILTLSNMARKAGPRLVQHSTIIIPVLKKLIVPNQMVNFEDANENIVAVRYHSLVVLECLVKMGPHYVAPYCSSLLDTSLRLIVLDPNFVENDDGDDASMNEFDGDDWGLEPDVAPEEDAGDTTWKVRMAALRLLTEWITCRTFKSALLSNTMNLFSRLTDRFNERDTAVRAQVLETFTSLVKRLDQLQSELPIDIISSQSLSPILERLQPHMMSANIEVKRSAASTLLALIELFKEGMFSGTINVFPLILSAIADKSDAAVQVIALESLKAAVQVLPGSNLGRMDLQAVLHTLVSIMVKDQGTLNVAPFEVVVALCRALRQGQPQFVDFPEIVSFFYPLFDLAKVLPITSSETAVAACLALAEFCSLFGGCLKSSDFQNCVELFLSSVEIRYVELTGLQCLMIVINCSVPSAQAALEPHTNRIWRTLLDLISSSNSRGIDAAVIGSHLSTLSAIISRYPSEINHRLLLDSLTICSRLEGASTMAIMHNLCAVIIPLCVQQDFPSCDEAIVALTDQAIEVLSNAESLQRSAIQSSQSLLMAISCLHSGNEPNELLERLLQAGSNPKHSVSAFSSTIASCYIQLYDIDRLVEQVNRLISSVERNPVNNCVILIVSIIGDIARLNSSLPESILNQFFSFLLSYINYSDEHVKSAAATSLGSITSANLPTLFPLLLEEVVKSDSASVCFHLHAIKEVLILLDVSQLSSDVANTIFSTLLKHAASENEGVRAIASECIGKLAALDKAHFSGKILISLKSTSHLLRASIVTAVKFYYTQMRDESVPAEAILPILDDPDLHVRRQTFLAFVALFSSAKQIKNLDTVLKTLIPLASQAIQVKTDLIRKIDFGAFQETVDEGLLLRQAAYSFLHTISELYPEHLPVKDVMLGLAKHGVNDPDIELQCAAYTMMSGIADRFAPGNPIDFLEELPANLLPSVKNCLAQIKRNPADGNARRVLTAFIIAIHKLHNLPGARADCPKLHMFYLQVLRTSLIANILKEYGLKH